MWFHYLLTAYRSFKRNKSVFFINLVGLTTGLTCTLLIFLWVNDELKMNGFHDPSVYQVMEHQDYSGDIMTTWSTPGLLAQSLQEDIPEIIFAATQTWTNSYTLTVEENKNFRAEGWHVGPEIFKIYNYPLLIGSVDEILKEKRSIAIEEKLAIKLFGGVEEAIGQPVVLQHDKTFLVSGVFKDLPRHSSHTFEFLLPLEDFLDENDWAKSWQSNGPSTVARLMEGADPKVVEAKIFDYVKKKNEESNVTLFLKPYAETYLYGSYKNGVQDGGRIEYVRLFSMIAVFILVIACINFMNLSTARAAKRAKEVGVRKAIGANKKSLFWQFIGESTLLTMGSLVLSVLLVALLIPTFNDITNKELVLDVQPGLIFTSIAMALLAGILAGSYPAIYLSHFKPATVLKGEIRSTLGEVWARKGLVVFQFTLSIILIVAVIAVYQQIEYAQDKNLGYNRNNLIYFEQEGSLEDELDVFLNGARNIPGVNAISSIGHQLLHRSNNTSGLQWEGKGPDERILFENVRVNYGMIELLEVEMKEGRLFSDEFGADTTKIIFNEKAINAMGLKDPIGKNIRLWDEYDLEIIGVVKDFHFQSLHYQVEPLFFWLSPENTWQVMARLEPSGISNTIKELQQYYEEFNQGFTFDFRFLNDEYAKLYAAEQRVSKLSRYFAGIAILISCLGLFGLATFTAERKIKEIGIRKVLGASSLQIILLLTRDFTKLVMVAIVIALPVSYYLVNRWLDNFAYSINLSIWYFVGAGFTALIISWLTISTQALHASRVNPADCLHDE